MILKKIKSIIIEIIVFAFIGLSPIWVIALQYWMTGGW